MLQLLLGLLLAFMGMPAQGYGRVETGLVVSSGFQVLFVSSETTQSRVGRVNNEALISQRLPGIGTNYYGWDGHGSTRFLLNPAGGITDTCAYDAYGLEVAGTGTTLNNYRYCGQQWDGDLGMYYLRARYYKPDTGRFWTMDSYEGNSQDPQSLHKYLYAQNNPVMMVDPSGHDGQLATLITAVGLAFAVDSLYTAAINPTKKNLTFAALNIATLPVSWISGLQKLGVSLNVARGFVTALEAGNAAERATVAILKLEDGLVLLGKGENILKGVLGAGQKAVDVIAYNKITGKFLLAEAKTTLRESELLSLEQKIRNSIQAANKVNMAGAGAPVVIERVVVTCEKISASNMGKFSIDAAGNLLKDGKELIQGVQVIVKTL